MKYEEICSRIDSTVKIFNRLAVIEGEDQFKLRWLRKLEQDCLMNDIKCLYLFERAYSTMDMHDVVVACISTMHKNPYVTADGKEYSLIVKKLFGIE